MGRPDFLRRSIFFSSRCYPDRDPATIIGDLIVQLKPPKTPFLYRENWGIQGFTFFSHFELQQGLWVLVRTAPLEQSMPARKQHITKTRPCFIQIF